MPILFCERCDRDTEFTYLDNAVRCKSCGWQMTVEEFRDYRKRVMMMEFSAISREGNWMEELYDELQKLVRDNPKLAEEIHRRNMKELEKLVKKMKSKKQKPVLGVHLI